MANAPTQLRNPPIVEAVFDVDCDLPPGFDLAALEEPARARFRDQYPKLRTQFIQEHRIETAVEAPPKMSTRLGVQAFQFLREDERQLVQVRTQGFSFNRLAPYTSLDDYLPEIERTWRLYADLVSPVQIRVIRLRYINRILLPMTTKGVDLDEFLKIGPRLPDQEKLELSGFLIQQAAAEKRYGARSQSGACCRSSGKREVAGHPRYHCCQRADDRTGGLVRYSADHPISAKLEKSHLQEYVDAEMHRIVPVVGLSVHLALQALAGGGSAISPEANAVHRAATKVVESAERSQALFGEKAAALSRLAELATECAEPGWDGEDAAAIDPTAVLWTKRFVRALPPGMPLPEFGPEPDGAISLDWIRSRNRLFSLSIGRSNRLAYAWLDGADKGHGVARFDGQNVPPRVLDGIERIVGPGHAGLRAA